MLMLELSFKPRVVQRQQRHLAELPEIRDDPDDADHHEIENVPDQRAQVRAVLFVRGDHQPVHVHHAEDDHHGGDDGEALHAALDVALQQQQEGEREMQHDQNHRELAPTAEGARDVPGNFVLDIAGPDDQELREREISPEHGEGQHQVAEVVELAGRDFFLDLFTPVIVHQATQHENNKRHRGERTDDHENHSVNRGEPFGLERHDPVNHRKRNGHAPEDQAGAADALQIFRQARIAAGILLARPFIQEMRQAHQNGEINYGAHDEKVGIQVRELEM